MKNYTRGQETFYARSMSFLKSLVRLLLLCSILGFLLCGFLAYRFVPDALWKNESAILAWARQRLKEHGIMDIPYVYDQVINLSWINVTTYKAMFESAAWIAISASVVLFVALILVFIRRGRKLLLDEHIRGSHLLTANAFNTACKIVAKREVNEIIADSGNPFLRLRLNSRKFLGNQFTCGADGVKIPEYALYRHIAMIGTTGVGKSTLIKHYLEYCRAHGEKVIIPDLNGEYADAFCQEGDVILSLYDKRSALWTFAGEKGIQAQDFARFLVPSGSEQNQFWWKGARTVLAQILDRYPMPDDLWAAVNSENGDLAQSLTGLAKKIAGKEGTTQASGITGSTLLDLGFLRDLNHWPKQQGKKEPFSIFDWARNDSPAWVFITLTDSDKAAMEPLFKLWLNIAILGLMRREKSESLPPLNLVVDELSSLGKIELLPMSLERARKYRGKVVLGYQSTHQLVHTYGRDQAGVIKNNIGIKCIYRCPDVADAKELADSLGLQEVNRRSSSLSYGPSSIGDRESISEHEALRNIVLESEIMALPDGHYFLKALEINPVKTRNVKKTWKISGETPANMGYPSLPQASAVPKDHPIQVRTRVEPAVSIALDEL